MPRRIRVKRGIPHSPDKVVFSLQEAYRSGYAAGRRDEAEANAGAGAAPLDWDSDPASIGEHMLAQDAVAGRGDPARTYTTEGVIRDNTTIGTLSSVRDALQNASPVRNGPAYVAVDPGAGDSASVYHEYTHARDALEMAHAAMEEAIYSRLAASFSPPIQLPRIDFVVPDDLDYSFPIIEIKGR